MIIFKNNVTFNRNLNNYIIKIIDRRDIIMRILSKLFRDSRTKQIGSKELNNLIKTNKGLLIIDVRDEYEYNSGHIPNSINIPVDSLYYSINSLTNYKNLPVAVYCKSGIRSETAANYLAQQGFRQIYVLRGGLNSYYGKLV